MDVEGCTVLTHALLDFIELHDPVEGEYEIEVSSPGIDRPLTRLADFARWSGHEAKIELHAPIATPDSPGNSQNDQKSGDPKSGDQKRAGQKRFRALLLGIDGQDVMIRSDNSDIRFPFAAIANAKRTLFFFAWSLEFAKCSVPEGKNLA